MLAWSVAVGNSGPIVGAYAGGVVTGGVVILLVIGIVFGMTKLRIAKHLESSEEK